MHSGLFDNYNSLNNSGKWLHVCEKKHLVYQGFLDEQKNITIGTEIKKKYCKNHWGGWLFSPFFSNEQSAILHANRCISKGILGGLLFVFNLGELSLTQKRKYLLIDICRGEKNRRIVMRQCPTYFIKICNIISFIWWWPGHLQVKWNSAYCKKKINKIMSTIHDWNIQLLFQAASDETGSKGEDLAVCMYGWQKEE